MILVIYPTPVLRRTEVATPMNTGYAFLFVSCSCHSPVYAPVSIKVLTAQVYSIIIRCGYVCEQNIAAYIVISRGHESVV